MPFRPETWNIPQKWNYVLFVLFFFRGDLAVAFAGDFFIFGEDDSASFVSFSDNFFLTAFLRGFLTFTSSSFSAPASSLVPNISSHFACMDSTPAPFNATFMSLQRSSSTNRQSMKT